MASRIILLAAALLTTLWAARPVAGAAPPQGTSPETLMDGFVEAWNSHDMKAFGRLLTEDAYWVPVVDVRLEGRANIVADLSKAHRAWAGTTTVAASDTVVRTIRPDVAVVLSHVGFVGKGGQVAKPPNALLLVTVKQADGWRIAAGQLTKPGSTQMPTS